MTITWVAGTGLADVTTPNRGTSQPVPYVGVPTLGERRIAIITATATDSDNVTPGVWRSLAAEGWTLIRDEKGGLPFHDDVTPALDHLFYPHRIAAWYKVLTGGESGTVVVGNASGSTFNSSVAVMDVYETSAPNFAIPVAYFGAMLSGPHASGRTLAIDEAAALLTGDHVHIGFSGDRSTGAIAPTAATITQTGATFGAVGLRSTLRNGIGDDAFMLTASAAVTGGSTNIPTVGFSNATSLPNDGPQFVVRLREDATAPLFINLTGIAAPSPAVGTGTVVSAGSPNIPLTGIMGYVAFGAMAMEQGIGVQLTGIPAPSPAVSPATVIFRSGEEPAHIELVGIAPPDPQFGEMEVSQPVIYSTPPCNWPVIACGEYPETASVELINRWERAAVELLYMRTGMQFGGCPVTIRPCQQCSGGSYEEWPVLSDSGWSGSWVPFLWSGAWSNLPAGCGCAGLHTCTPSEIWLPSAAASITNVKVDGAILDPSAYRVDNGNLLVRQDGERWPTSQNLGAPDDAAGTFSITYVPGPAVPVLGQVAAGALALEFVRACLGLPCRLPAGVQSITRQGVEMTLIQDDDTAWLTGVKEADDFLNTYNPNRRRQSWVISSPDIQPARVQSWSA